MPLMPLSEDDLQGSILPESIATTAPIKPERSVMDAAFSQENAIASYITKWNNVPGLPTPVEVEDLRTGKFDYKDHMPAEHAEYESEYARYATNERTANWVAQNIQKRLEHRQTIDEAGIPGFLAMTVAAMTSPEQYPTYFIPAALILKPGVLAGSRSALITAEAGIATVGAAAGEAVLHATQPTRTPEESAFAIAASAIFGGLVTGGIMTVKGVNKSAQEFAADIDADLRIMDGDPRPDEIDPRNMGAAEAVADVHERKRVLIDEAEGDLKAATDAGNLEQIGRLQDKVTRLNDMPAEELTKLKHPKLAKALGFMSPAIRLAGARTTAVREIAATLIDDTMLRRANEFGDTLPPSVESKMSVFEQEMGLKTQHVMDTVYKLYKQNEKSAGRKAQDLRDFAKEVGKALRNKDQSVNGNDFVSKVAQQLRSEIFEPIEIRLDAQNMLEREVTNWDNLKYEDLEEFMEPDLIPDFFKTDGTPRSRIKNLPNEVRDHLVTNGKLQTKIKLPPGDESYLHRLWDFDAVRERPYEFENRVRDHFYSEAEKEVRSNTIEKAQTKLQEAETEILAREQKLGEAKTKAVGKGKKPGGEKVVRRSYSELEQYKAKNKELRDAGKTVPRRSREQIVHDLKLEVTHVRDIEVPRAKKDYEAQMKVVAGEVDTAARKVRQTIEGSLYDPTINVNNIKFEGKGSALKLRTLNMPSHLIEDFLENDIEKVAQHYVRSVNAPLHFKETFEPSPAGRVKVDADPQAEGSKALESRMGELEQVYEDLAEAEHLKGNIKGAKRIRKEWADHKTDIGAMHESLFGRYKMPDNPDGFWNQARARLKEFNIMTMLGMVTVSSVPDIGNYIARRGMVAFARDMARLATNLKTMKLSAQRNRVMGVSADLMNSSRLEKIYMMDDHVAPIGNSKLGKGWENARNVFTKATGMPYWNNFWKNMTATSYIDDIITDAIKVSKGELSDKAIEGYARGNISKADLKAIAKNIDTKADSIDGVWVPDVGKWKDQTLVDRLKAAVRKEVDMTIVTPGKGDLPLISRSEIGKLVFQFKSFSMAANNRILMAGLDDMSADRVAGLLAATTLGYASYAAKETLKGKEVDTSYDTFIREGLDRSGQLAIYGEVNGMLSKMTGGQLDAFRLAGAEQKVMTRYAARNTLGAILGVSAGRVSDIGQITSAVASGEYRESDIRAIRRSIIFNNLWATHYGFTKIEKAAGGTQ